MSRVPHCGVGGAWRGIDIANRIPKDHGCRLAAWPYVQSGQEGSWGKKLHKNMKMALNLLLETCRCHVTIMVIKTGMGARRVISPFPDHL